MATLIWCGNRKSELRRHGEAEVDFAIIDDLELCIVAENRSLEDVEPDEDFAFIVLAHQSPISGGASRRISRTNSLDDARTAAQRWVDAYLP